MSNRLAEMTQVLVKNKITQGMTPQKLRTILEELGPTYIKLGQIMSLHSDILPRSYCDELMKLNSDVTPMPFTQVERLINEYYQCRWQDIFASVDTQPLGSASIAQVHRARLKNGEDVIIKVQREGIFVTMSRDISLLKRAARIVAPVTHMKGIVDFNMVLDELWSVAQEEMDFLKEAANMEEFAHCNKDIRYVAVPKLYKEYTTSRILVMEYIGGCPINDKTALQKEGYDLDEIGTKYVNNFMKQVMDDGYFHADPHPGNVKVCNGKIVWIDMGMMGRLSERDRRIMVRAVSSIAMHDINGVENAVLDLGEIKGEPNRAKLYMDLQNFLDEYSSAGMGDIDVPTAFMQILEIMKNNGIALPHGVTMLARGLTHVQGVLSEISPKISMLDIAMSRLWEEREESFDWKQELKSSSRHIYRSMKKGVDIPSLTADVLKDLQRGQLRTNMLLQISGPFSEVLFQSVRNLVVGLCIAALIVGSSIICTTDMEPKLFGIPAVGVILFVGALFVAGFYCIRHIYHKFSKPKSRDRKFRE